MCKNFQILSLDGGGIKGLFSSAVLAFLEEDHGTKITEHFDLIVGTSTGGLIALALGMGLKARQIVSFFVHEGPKIFPTIPFSNKLQYVTPKYNPENLEKALKNCFGDTTLADSKKRLVITSYNIGEDDIYLFKTPHHDRLKRDWKIPLWKVAMATSAAPTYFPSFQQLDRMRLIDGGVWANNPSMVGVIEAASILEKPLESIRVLSLGTTDEVKGRPKCLDHGGKWHWREEAVNIILRGQSLGVHTQVQHLLGKENVIRLDPKVPDGMFELDKLSEEELLSKAAHESRHFSSQFGIFASHISDEYIPIYSRRSL